MTEGLSFCVELKKTLKNTQDFDNLLANVCSQLASDHAACAQTSGKIGQVLRETFKRYSELKPGLRKPPTLGQPDILYRIGPDRGHPRSKYSVTISSHTSSYCQRTD